MVREPIIVPQSARSGQSALPETNRYSDCGGRGNLVQSSIEPFRQRDPERIMSQENLPPNHLFKLVVVVSAAFVLTILLMIVTAFSSIENPLAIFFNEYGLKLIGVEVALILVLAFGAMWLDGKQTVAAQQDVPSGNDAASKDQQ